MTVLASPWTPILVDATVARRDCTQISPCGPGRQSWSLGVTYRRAAADLVDDCADRLIGVPPITVTLPLSDEFAAYQIDLLLRAVKRGEWSAGRLLFIALHDEWGRLRLLGRDPAWDALFAFLAPMAAGAGVPPQDHEQRVDLPAA